MKKSILFFLMLTILTLLSSEAAVYKGQRYFKKQCVACHSNGQTFVVQKDTETWENLMKDDGIPLAKLHTESKDPKAADSKKYFEGKKYKKSVKHLRDFFIEYSSDSGNIPAC